MKVYRNIKTNININIGYIKNIYRFHVFFEILHNK